MSITTGSRPALPDEATLNTVSGLTTQIKTFLEASFASVWVVGEISSLARPTSGHLYFTLKDSDAVLRAVMWRNTALRHRYAAKEGQEVLCRGRVTVYPPRGDYQMIVEEMHQKGAGAQDLALRRLREKLHKLGWFAPERKKKLPRFPRRLALVASPTGAAVRDMLEILGRRWPCAELWVCGVRVQGDGAADEIAAAVDRLNEFRGIDAIILGRGGGSSDDLAAFNEEKVARAIHESRIPIVSAVGHEVDVTIADLVADVRALTPSEAAERTTPDREELIEHLRNRRQRLHDLLRGKMQTGKQRFLGLAQRRVFEQPLERLRELECRLDAAEARLHRALQVRVERGRGEVEAAAGKLQTLSPLNVLARGYSLTRFAATGQLVRSVRQAAAADVLEILLADGRLTARVEGVETGRDATP